MTTEKLNIEKFKKYLTDASFCYECLAFPTRKELLSMDFEEQLAYRIAATEFKKEVVIKLSRLLNNEEIFAAMIFDKDPTVWGHLQNQKLPQEYYLTKVQNVS